MITSASAILASEAAVSDLTEDVINALCLVIQKKIGQDDGGIAGVHFSGGEKRRAVASVVRDYLKTEAAYEEADDAAQTGAA